MHVNRFVGVPEMQVFAPRVRDRQTGRGHVRLAGQEFRQYLGDAVDRVDNEPHAEFVGECLHEIV